MHPLESSRVPLVTGVLLCLVGTAVGATGVWLIRLGGSPYYVAAGAGFLLTGLLLMWRQASALPVYALLLLGSLGWALWEAGLDWWPLAARLDVLFVIGLFLLTPWVTRALGPLVEVQPAAEAAFLSRSLRDGSAVGRYGTPTPRTLRPSTTALRGSGLPLTLAMLLAAVVALSSFFQAAQGLPGRVRPAPATPISPRAPTAAPAAVALTPAVPPREWHAHGRTGFGQRYSLRAPSPPPMSLR